MESLFCRDQLISIANENKIEDIPLFNLYGLKSCCRDFAGMIDTTTLFVYKDRLFIDNRLHRFL